MSLELHYNVFGCFRTPREDIELAKSAVDAGFEGIWTGDHFMPWIDSRPYTHHPFPWFGSLLSEIPDVPVGTSVTCPMLRYRPAILAQQIATLDNMYPGRFNLGVGVGEALNEAHFIDGEWPDWQTRADMLIESLELMNTLWSSDEYISFDGDHFQHDDIKLYTRPAGDVPLHWAGWGPTSCQYAGRFADHLLTAASAEAIADRILPAYEDGLEMADKSLTDVDVTTEVTANVGDPETLVADIRDRGEYIPVEELDNSDPRSIQSVADEELADMSDEEIIEANNITDDPAALLPILEELEDAGVTRVLVGSNCGDPYRTIEAFADDVIPYFA